MNHFPTNKPSAQESSDNSPEHMTRAVMRLAGTWGATFVMDDSHFSILMPDEIYP
jgi:hypothetical protein